MATRGLRGQRNIGSRTVSKRIVCIIDPLLINLLITGILYGTMLFVVPVTPSLISSFAFLTLALYVLYAMLAGVDWFGRHQLLVCITRIQKRISLRCAFTLRWLPVSRGTRFHLFGFSYVNVYWCFWSRVHEASGFSAPDVDLLVALPFLLLWLHHTLVLYGLVRDSMSRRRGEVPGTYRGTVPPAE